MFWNMGLSSLSDLGVRPKGLFEKSPSGLPKNFQIKYDRGGQEVSRLHIGYPHGPLPHCGIKNNPRQSLISLSGTNFCKNPRYHPRLRETLFVLPSSLRDNGAPPSDTTPAITRLRGSVCPRKSIRRVSVPRFQHRRVSMTEEDGYYSSSQVFDDDI